VAPSEEFQTLDAASTAHFPVIAGPPSGSAAHSDSGLSGIQDGLDPSGTIRWVDLTEDYRVRARPETVLQAFDEMTRATS
jgi:hypothetical protein